jgi:hypothetical protein
VLFSRFGLGKTLGMPLIVNRFAILIGLAGFQGHGLAAKLTK